jgi:hypothetical protein
MLNNILEEEDDCFVFFYADNDPEAHAILAELEGTVNIFLLLADYCVKYKGVVLAHFTKNLVLYALLILIITKFYIFSVYSLFGLLSHPPGYTLYTRLNLIKIYVRYNET